MVKPVKVKVDHPLATQSLQLQKKRLVIFVLQRMSICMGYNWDYNLMKAIPSAFE